MIKAVREEMIDVEVVVNSTTGEKITKTVPKVKFVEKKILAEIQNRCLQAPPVKPTKKRKRDVEELEVAFDDEE